MFCNEWWNGSAHARGAPVAHANCGYLATRNILTAIGDRRPLRGPAHYQSGLARTWTALIPLLLLFTLLGSLFSIAVGLLVGSIVNTTNAAGAFGGVVSFLYILPIFFVGSFAQLLGGSPVTQIIKVLPPYYIADGASNALTNANALPATMLDISVTIGVTLVLVLLSLWTLRRQAAVVSTI